MLSLFPFVQCRKLLFTCGNLKVGCGDLGFKHRSRFLNRSRDTLGIVIFIDIVPWTIFRRPIRICKFRRPYFLHGLILATIPDYRAVRFIMYFVGSIMVHPYELSEYLTMPMDFGFSLGKLLYIFDMSTAHR